MRARAPNRTTALSPSEQITDAPAMLHARIVAPPDLTPTVLDHLLALGSIINLTHFPAAARKPDGDLVLFDVAREDASAVVEALKELGCATRGSITLTTIELSVSHAATQAELVAEGSGANAVVWDDVLAKTSDSAELNLSFLAFMILAALIAAVGILTDSLVLIIGAMVVGPEFGPLAGLCVALVQRRFDLAARSAWALGVGFVVAVVATMVFMRGMVLLGLASATMLSTHPQTLFISRPDAWAGVIALLAGVAGMLSLTTSKPGALIGVFISVTTIPAAANMGVAAAFAQWAELRGSAVQLGVNLLVMIVAGVGTLVVQRIAYGRRRRLAIRRPR